jgi:act minimal PKS chain-length factor (CLF/KS beta)
MMTTAVVTGIGVVAPNGVGTADYWRATVAGRSGIRPITRFDPSPYPVRLAGEVPGFVAEQYMPARLIPQTDSMTRLSLAAAKFALDDSALEVSGEAGLDVGITTSASMGGFEFGQREMQNLWREGPEYVSAYQSFAWFYAVNSGQISIRNGLRGPGSAMITDDAGGVDVVGHARRQIRKGARAMITGGVDGALCPLGVVGRLRAGLLNPTDDARQAYLPFAAGAAGHVPAEGGAILVLESAVAARARGITEYGEIAGYAATFDPDPDDPRPDGLARAIRGALTDARTAPCDIDVVFADAAAQPELDRSEALTLAQIFGAAGVPVTAPKTMIGRLCAGGGALDLATALLSLRDGVIPPTVNVAAAAPGYPIDLVTGDAREATLNRALVLARGANGFNAAMVVRRA